LRRNTPVVCPNCGEQLVPARGRDRAQIEVSRAAVRVT